MVQLPKSFGFELLVSRLSDWHWWHYSLHLITVYLILFLLSVLPSKLSGLHSMSLSPRRIFEFLSIKFRPSLGLWYQLVTKNTNTLGFCFPERPRVRQKQYWCQALILFPPKSGRAALLALKVLRGFLSRFPGRASPGDQMSVWVWERSGTASLWLVPIPVINTSETAPPHFLWLQVPGANY